MGMRETDLSEIVAKDALRRLVIAYSRAVDRRDFALLRSLYDDEAEEIHGEMFRGGADAYVAFVEKALSNYEATVHYVVNSALEISGDRAEGEVHKINYHRTHGPQSHEVITGSRSLDIYRRRDGQWRFMHRSITLDWSVKRPVDPGAYKDFAAGSPPGQAGPHDASYQLLTLFGRYGQ